jgi:hypothetical protein
VGPLVPTAREEEADEPANRVDRRWEPPTRTRELAGEESDGREKRRWGRGEGRGVER